MALCGKRRRSHSRILSSDSEETDVDKTENDETSEKRRTSRRLFEKSERPKFKRMSRDEIWDKIPSGSTDKKLSRLTPKKTVNDFTKIYNTYNYDDYEDTGDESDIISSGSSDSNSGKHRIKNYHKRIRAQSSSSESDDGNAPNKTKDVNHATESGSANEITDELGDNKKMDPQIENDQTDLPVCLTPFKMKHSVQVLESDSEPRESESGNESDSESDVEILSEHEDESQNGSGSEDESGSERSCHSSDEIESRAARLKREKLNQFSELKKSFERRKSRLSDQSNPEQR